ncbi:hypothetical protein SAMN05216489_00097 [Streptomyces sp. 3213]|uniref:hypothetical protein n=1 Tax=Streptomyces sp. 3213.3 TaxID=1855348 RepID=UPI00089AA4CA|nr:hypothetical protein [Streptomyces sp. 3213.3]SEC18362.1 hypothetical protein SAMN05216489_00097 [Streptomyces sp. 3213] [Streptomyces sp. 3213.3]
MRGLYDRIVTSLGGTPKYQSAALAAQASAALAAEVDERGRTPAVVIDKSHLLDHHELDAIRMLTNYDMDSTTPFETGAPSPTTPTASSPATESAPTPGTPAASSPA